MHAFEGLNFEHPPVPVPRPPLLTHRILPPVEGRKTAAAAAKAELRPNRWLVRLGGGDSQGEGGGSSRVLGGRDRQLPPEMTPENLLEKVRGSGGGFCMEDDWKNVAPEAKSWGVERVDLVGWNAARRMTCTRRGVVVLNALPSPGGVEASSRIARVEGRGFLSSDFSAFGSNKIDADLVAEFLARPSLSVPSIPKPRAEPACVHHVHYLAKEREMQPRSCSYLVSAHLV